MVLENSKAKEDEVDRQIEMVKKGWVGDGEGTWVMEEGHMEQI